MSKHTPGPWHIVLSNNATLHILHEHGEDSTDIDDLSSRICVMPAEICTNYNSFANARLIAAAPDLLGDLIEAAVTLRRYEALHRAKNTEESTAKAEVNAALATRFEATIAKARGES